MNQVSNGLAKNATECLEQPQANNGVLPAKTTLQGPIQTCPAASSETCGMPMWMSPTYNSHFVLGHVATAAKALLTTSSAKQFGMEANVPACKAAKVLNQLGFAFVKHATQRRLLMDNYARNNLQGHELFELRCPTPGKIRASSKRHSQLPCRLCTSLFHVPRAIDQQPCPVKAPLKRHPELSSRRTKIFRKARWWGMLRKKWPQAITA